MNKKFIYAALASLAMVGCAKTEGVKPVKQAETIAFRTVSSSITRAETTTANLPSFFSVGINLIDNANSFLYEMTLTRPAASSNSWDTQVVWPGSKVQFFNIAAKNDDGTLLALNHTKLFIKDGSPATKISNQASTDDDTFIKINAGGSDGNTSSASYLQKAGKNDNRILNKGRDVVTNALSHDQQSDALAITFKHIYSQIVIKALNEKADKFTVKVIGAGIANVNSTGTFNFPTDFTTLKGDLNSSWADVTTPVVYGNAWNVTAVDTKDPQIPAASTAQATTLTNQAVAILNPTTSKETQGFYLIPQKLTLWNKTSAPTGSYLKVFVQISTVAQGSAQAAQLFPNAQNKFASVLVPIPDNFTANNTLIAGKKYIFTIKFFHSNNGAGKVDPKPGDNGNYKPSTNGDGGGDPSTTDDKGDNPDIDNNPYKKGKNPGDDVLSTETIKFNPTVEDWVEVNVTDIEL